MNQIITQKGLIIIMSKEGTKPSNFKWKLLTEFENDSNVKKSKTKGNTPKRENKGKNLPLVKKPKSGNKANDVKIANDKIGKKLNN